VSLGRVQVMRQKPAVKRRFDTDEEWAQLAPLLAAIDTPKGWALARSRQVLNGILFWVRTGAHGGTCPALWVLGDGLQAVCALADRWDLGPDQGHVAYQADGAGELDWDAQIDSRVVRAHQHAAGARRGSPRSRQAASRRWGGHGAGADHQVAHHLRWA
jgi:hypothetical protein